MDEDIKILEERVITLKRHIKNYEESNCKTNIYQQLIKECQAIENLIKGYREYKNFYHRRLKEWRTKFENQEKHFLNELDEYDEEREKIKKQLENSIPKSKVKEKIEELEEEKKYYYSDYKIDELNDKIKALQELMEE